MLTRRMFRRRYMQSNSLLIVCEFVIIGSGILFFVFGYIFNISLERRDNTLRFSQIYNSSPYVEMQRVLRAPFLTEQWLEFLDRNESGQIQREAYASFLRDAVDDEAAIQQSLMASFAFFRSVKQCIEAERCDAELANELFAVPARETYCAYLPLVDEMIALRGFPDVVDIVMVISPDSASC